MATTRKKREVKIPEGAVPEKVTVIDDGIVITTAAKSLEDMVAEMALEINNKVVAWVGDRHDCSVEVYRGKDQDQYLLTRDGKAIDKLILKYTNTGLKEIPV